MVVSAFVPPRAGAGRGGGPGAFCPVRGGECREGSPRWLCPWATPTSSLPFPDVGTYLLAWGPHEVSQRAAARALVGESAISGRLPISLPPFHRLGEGLHREAWSPRFPGWVASRQPGAGDRASFRRTSRVGSRPGGRGEEARTR